MPTNEPAMRDRILHVALELFTERGYEGTSLREIAERLEVTKAALYYHFKSKDAILLSLLAEMTRSVDELVNWGRSQDFSPEFQREMLNRLADLFYGDTSRIVRLVQENRPVIHALASRDNQAIPKTWILDVLDLLTPPDADLYTKIRVRTAMMAVVFGPVADRQLDNGAEPDLEQQKKISLAIAYELLAQS
ncbi:TetR/AcrR family transcriptional regulator [Skermania sp. ID1734]|uniref:TetR/AcrR family transcriptional regulator n=1 Tax=Skermania sp. ID1734 TaxID=2597516 RepID=UPI00117D96A2|nr:TetR/AcrR family transcriptional regulator [Skermania sp. ID1734]TSD99911.1 TetR/AcrR family transcriptional regulator [Skermania sp. ID1734]